ncbi:hypothetical protein [Roseovarius phycicola]|uniref:Uncharacterized protein n=1 Tax=Roseovarius phycicola TaxID=3080976 RepID=A0ABZ2HIY8_9RHOB
MTQLETPVLGVLGDADAPMDKDEDIDLDELLAASALPTPAE